MPQVNLGKTRLSSAMRYLEILSEAAEVYMAIRDKPNALDWLAVGTRVVNVSYRAWREWKGSRQPFYFDFISDHEDTWMTVPDDVSKLVMSYTSAATVVPEYWDGDPDSGLLVEARVGDEVIRWNQDGKSGPVSKGPFMLRSRENETLEEIGKCLWRELATDSVVFARGKVTQDTIAKNVGVLTEESVLLHNRLLSFYNAGCTHSCLLVGPPGAGKSTAIRQLSKRLGLKTLKISVSSLNNEDGRPTATFESVGGVRAILKMLKPEVIILEDLDRLVGSADLLDLLEVARVNSKLIIASANGTEVMMGAALRPGRFDDIITYTGLDSVLVDELSNSNQEVSARLKQLPLAYAYEYAKRLRVLGEEQAISELTELEDRATRCGQEDLYE